jgi:hypothetical protein
MKPDAAKAKKPQVGLVFEETELFADQRRRKTGDAGPSSSPQRGLENKLDLGDDEDNPLLTPTEEAEKKQQEQASLFLTGVGIGALLVGSYFLGQWIWKKFSTGGLEPPTDI